MQALTVGRWLGAHVEAAVIQAALELGLLGRLAGGGWSPAGLARQTGLQTRGVSVVLEALNGMGIVDRGPDGYWLAADLRLPEPVLVDASRWPPLQAAHQAWAPGDTSSPDYALLLESAESVIREATPDSVWLVEAMWRHVWYAAIVSLATEGVLAALQPGARSVAALSAASGLPVTALAALLRAGQDTGVVSVDGDDVQLTPAARSALGEASVPNFGHWMAQRLRMERTYFWQPLAQLADSLRRGQPASRISAPDASAGFRASFTRVNQPLLPLLLRTARRVAHDLGAGEQPWRVLELGTSLGHWGAALAAAHPHTTVVAVDAPQVLATTRRLVGTARLSERYDWRPTTDLTCLPEFDDADEFDVVVVHEICHTLPPDRLTAWLANATARLAPDGRLLIADMLLEPGRASPQRHLTSAVKLLVTGGGRLLDTHAAAATLHAQPFSAARCYRLPTTDLLVATRGGSLPEQLGSWRGEPIDPNRSFHTCKPESQSTY